MNNVQIIPITGLSIIKEGNDIAQLICQATEKQGTPIENNDVIVVTHVIVARAEGNVVDVDTVTPSEYAKKIANKTQKDPKLVEVILRESQKVVRTSKGKLITQTKHGIVCANSGIDQSNVAGTSIVALLPEDSNQSAKKIREGIRKNCGKDVAVIVSDTHGRPFRRGEINIALGTCGFEPLRDRRGEKDLFGYTIRLKRTAIADELASAAELVIGQTNEGIPAAIIRGYNYPKSETVDATKMLRSAKEDLFI
ncbi:MAG: coenzyme F420-0:L-glutamate ligase [Candidatus Bathyarchaeota archaeon]|nr:coenzyme F420-0:L-glutamate ligase [Candidatus Bathyarchaeota archaeon]